MSDDHDLPPIEDLLGGMDDFDMLFGDANSHDPSQTMIDGGVVNWRELDPADESAVWGQLRVFVDWLIDRYQLTESLIPDCWYQHGRLVEELSALRSAWVSSFSSLDAGYGPIGWHERFAALTSRISGEGDSCGSGHMPVYTRKRVDDAHTWAEWVALISVPRVVAAE
jgi:hypothetical protein